MTLQEYIDGLSQSVGRLGEVLSEFVGVLFGVEPWLESNVIYVFASLFCYVMLVRWAWGCLTGLPTLTKAWVVQAKQNVFELRKCSWRRPIDSSVALVSFSGFVLASFYHLALVSVGSWLVGFVVYHWLTEIVFI